MRLGLKTWLHVAPVERRIKNPLFYFWPQTLIIALGLIFLFGCGQDDSDTPQGIERYFPMIQDEFKRHGRDFEPESIRWQLMTKKNRLGQRIWGESIGGTIRIDRELWDSGNETRKELVLWHEMGHLVLGRGHVQSSRSIMVWSVEIIEDAFKRNRMAFLDELFNPPH